MLPGGELLNSWKILPQWPPFQYNPAWMAVRISPRFRCEEPACYERPELLYSLNRMCSDRNPRLLPMSFPFMTLYRKISLLQAPNFEVYAQTENKFTGPRVATWPSRLMAILCIARRGEGHDRQWWSHGSKPQWHQPLDGNITSSADRITTRTRGHASCHSFSKLKPGKFITSIFSCQPRI
jgi:hypothetical protein